MAFFPLSDKRRMVIRLILAAGFMWRSYSDMPPIHLGAATITYSISLQQNCLK